MSVNSKINIIAPKVWWGTPECDRGWAVGLIVSLWWVRKGLVEEVEWNLGGIWTGGENLGVGEVKCQGRGARCEGSAPTEGVVYVEEDDDVCFMLLAFHGGNPEVLATQLISLSSGDVCEHVILSIWDLSLHCRRCVSWEILSCPCSGLDPSLCPWIRTLNWLLCEHWHLQVPSEETLNLIAPSGST